MNIPADFTHVITLSDGDAGTPVPYCIAPTQVADLMAKYLALEFVSHLKTR